jgi:hypothetical protein
MSRAWAASQKKPLHRRTESGIEQEVKMAKTKNLPQDASGVPAGSQKPGSPASYLAQDYTFWRILLEAQPNLVRHFLETQARNLADALVSRSSQVRFTLPDKVVVEAGEASHAKPAVVPVPAAEREQMAGGLIDRMTRADVNLILAERLTELESSPSQPVAVSAGLIRFCTASQMVSDMLPSGRSVQYRSADDEQIPSIPLGDLLEAASAITASTDAIAEGEAGDDVGRGELQVPYTPWARHFYLPQWVPLDEKDHLLVKSASEAESAIASMQQYLRILHTAVSLAPYMVVDETYQRKRYGILGQLVNQGRALARYQTQEIIRTIHRRAKVQDLNRGLSLSLPYFDDQNLLVAIRNFEIIPAGRIMFTPAFVVRATRQEQVKVAQDTRLSPSTRKHLLEELHSLEKAFER